MTTPTKPTLPILDDEHPVWLAIVEYELAQTPKGVDTAIHKLDAELVAMLKAHEAVCIEHGKATMREDAAMVCEKYIKRPGSIYPSTTAAFCSIYIRALPIKEQE